ncbi:hypothetical protein [Sphingobium sp. YR657]
MTLRIKSNGRDPLTTAPQTQWQNQRTRGPILPMEKPRRPRWWQFWKASR